MPGVRLVCRSLPVLSPAAAVMTGRTAFAWASSRTRFAPKPNIYMDVPVGQMAGVSGRRERVWGWAGGVIGSLVGIGGLLVAVLVQDAPLRDLLGAPYPRVFTRRSMIALDYYFVGLMALGLLFLEAGIVALRKSRYPRTDGSGAALLGAVLCAL